jgi:hypothetical protein
MRKENGGKRSKTKLNELKRSNTKRYHKVKTQNESKRIITKTNKQNESQAKKCKKMQNAKKCKKRRHTESPHTQLCVFPRGAFQAGGTTYCTTVCSCDVAFCHTYTYIGYAFEKNKNKKMSFFGPVQVI